jgi:molecular chaperone GrpE (heat shock protein)
MPNLKQPQNITKQVMKRKIKKRNEIREASLSLYIMRILRSLDDLTRMTDSITNKKVLACTTKLVQTTSIIFYQ